MNASILIICSLLFGTYTFAQELNSSTVNPSCSLKYPDGGTYTGSCKDGKREGYGIYNGGNGVKFEGTFKDNKPEGSGKLKYPDGATYVGEFNQGKPSGKGTYTFPNGNKYVGEFKDGKRSGGGVYHFADGRKKACIWSDDKCITETSIEIASAENPNDVRLTEQDSTSIVGRSSPSANSSPKPSVATSQSQEFQQKSQQLTNSSIHSRPILGPAKMNNGFEYVFFGKTSSCTDNDKMICLLENEYKLLCSQSQGVTRESVNVYGLNTPYEDFVKNSTFDNFEVNFSKSNGGGAWCYASVKITGLFKGKSTNAEFNGIVTRFIKNEKDQVLVNYFSYSDPLHSFDRRQDAPFKIDIPSQDKELPTQQARAPKFNITGYIKCAGNNQIQNETAYGVANEFEGQAKVMDKLNNTAYKGKGCSIVRWEKR